MVTVRAVMQMAVCNHEEFIEEIFAEMYFMVRVVHFPHSGLLKLALQRGNLCPLWNPNTHNRSRFRLTKG
jgi:hypothetical protein